jgi:AraC-like DNA-binding protein
MIAAIIREYHNYPNPIYLAKSNLLLGQFITTVLELAAKNEKPSNTEISFSHFKKIQQVKILIENNYKSKLNVKDIIQKTGMSVNYFSEMFKTHTGFTLYDYYLYCKIENAKLMLIENKMNISEIAFELGFNNLQHFSNCFKKKTNMFPRVYIKTIKSNN